MNASRDVGRECDCSSASDSNSQVLKYDFNHNTVGDKRPEEAREEGKRTAPCQIVQENTPFCFFLCKINHGVVMSQTHSFASSCRFDLLACGGHPFYSTLTISCKRRQRVISHTKKKKKQTPHVLHQRLQREIRSKSIVLIICSSILLCIVPSGHLPGNKTKKKVKNNQKLYKNEAEDFKRKGALVICG